MSDLFCKVHDTLPIFKMDNNHQSILYTPGFYITLDNSIYQEIQNKLSHPEGINNPETKKQVENLLEHARKACDAWNHMHQRDFEPECLTVHVGSDCNFNCSYCYSKVDDTRNNKIAGFPSLESIESVFRFMIAEHRSLVKPLTIVYHGAGEPTLHWQQLTEAYQRITSLALKADVKVFSYIATNAALSEAQVDWLVQNMSLIGVSCDGPPAVQKKQRSFNKASTLPVEAVCKHILEKGGKFDIRVTITPETITQQLEITRYLIDACSAQTIHIEPVYLAGDKGFKKEDADIFTKSFLAAQDYARTKGVNVLYAGVRQEEIHGSYCDVLRQTVRLTPDAQTRNCFCFMKDSDSFITGKYSSVSKEYKMNPMLVALQKRASGIPKECMSCINIFHCSRGCPECCLFSEDPDEECELIPFRCLFHQQLTVERIKRMVNHS